MPDAIKCFRLPKSVSIYPEYLRLNVSSRVVYVETSKMKILGVACYGITMPKAVSNTDNPKSTQGMVIWMACHTIADSDGNPNLLGVNRNDRGLWVNAYNGKPT